MKGDAGKWDLNHNLGENKFLVAFVRGRGATIEVTCAPTGGLHVFLTRREGSVSPTSVRFLFHDDDGAELRSLQWRDSSPEWYASLPSRGSPGVLIHRMDGDSQKVIDGMLLGGVVTVDVEFEVFRTGVDEYSLDVTGFSAVHDLLSDYCHRTPAEVQATIAAEALTAPTPTPTPLATLTPTPPVIWQQEWCREQGNPNIEVESFWHPVSGVQGTARLIVRCASGVLVVAVHITRSDGAYPENQSGIALAVQRGREIEHYRHYVDRGPQQVRGSADEGLLMILSDAAAKDVVEAMYGPQFKDSRRLGLWGTVRRCRRPEPRP